MSAEELRTRFAYHPAHTEQRRLDHESVRNVCRHVAESLDTLCPDGREKALALTKLEEVMFWANAAVARQPGD
ncbi:Acb2/Tad1 domain-containing protein [Streptomyces nigrescens]